MNLAATDEGITSEANVTDIHEALNFDQNDSVSAARLSSFLLVSSILAYSRGWMLKAAFEFPTFRLTEASPMPLAAAACACAAPFKSYAVRLHAFSACKI